MLDWLYVETGNTYNKLAIVTVLVIVAISLDGPFLWEIIKSLLKLLLI